MPQHTTPLTGPPAVVCFPQAMPIGDRALPIRRTHFTVISGPHVHKTAREQFARTTHSRVIQVGTNNLSELNWLLHSIKMYK